jgi:hypothetical protein
LFLVTGTSFSAAKKTAIVSQAVASHFIVAVWAAWTTKMALLFRLRCTRYGLCSKYFALFSL